MLPHIKIIFACCLALENFIPKLIIHHTPPLSPKAQTHFNPWRHAVDDSIPTSVYLESKSVPLQPVCMQHRGRVRMLRIAQKCISAVGVGPFVGTPFGPTACLPAYLPACLPACLPAGGRAGGRPSLASLRCGGRGGGRGGDGGRGGEGGRGCPALPCPCPALPLPCWSPWAL